MATVDILMATYNGERYVQEQIESIQAQSFSDWRLLVSDDCSEDNTLLVLREICRKDSRIKIVSEGIRHGSAKANFMYLLSIADADYIMLSDQDDVWLPEKIEITLEAMHLESALSSDSTPLLVFSDMVVVDDDLNEIAKSFERYSRLRPNRTGFPQVLAQAIGAGCTYMVNRCLVDRSLRCVDLDSVIMHDWWLTIVASAFGSIKYIDRPLSLYRQHEYNVVGATRFSILNWIGRLDDMVDRQQSIAKQARCFSSSYHEACDSRVLRIARECEATCSGSRLTKLAHLIRCGAWKPGTRKFGQILAVLK